MVLHKLTGFKSFWFSAADQWLGRGLGVAISALHGSGHFSGVAFWGVQDHSPPALYFAGSGYVNSLSMAVAQGSRATASGLPRALTGG